MKTEEDRREGTPWLHGFLFLTRDSGWSLDLGSEPWGGVLAQALQVPIPWGLLANSVVSYPPWHSFLAMPPGLWDLSSLTRDRTRAPYSGSAEP